VGEEGECGTQEVNPILKEEGTKGNSMATNRGCASRFLVACAASLLLAGCLPSPSGPDEAKSGAAGVPDAAAPAIPSDARQFIAEALKAHGGEGALTRARLGRTIKKSVRHVSPTRQTKETETCLYQLPDRLFRMHELEANGRTGTLVFVVRGQEGWMNKDGTVVERPPQKEDMRRRLYPVGILLLLKDLVDSSDSLAYIPPAEFASDKEIGVRATRPQKKEDFFFDKQRRLLVRVVETQTDSATKASKTVEVRFSDFREMHGMVFANSGQVYENGVLAQEWTLEEFKVVSQIDEKVFSKPAGK
jgi:hypothetical protein